MRSRLLNAFVAVLVMTAGCDAGDGAPAGGRGQVVAQVDDAYYREKAATECPSELGNNMPPELISKVCECLVSQLPARALAIHGGAASSEQERRESAPLVFDVINRCAKTEAERYFDSEVSRHQGSSAGMPSAIAQAPIATGDPDVDRRQFETYVNQRIAGAQGNVARNIEMVRGLTGQSIQSIPNRQEVVSRPQDDIDPGEAADRAEAAVKEAEKALAEADAAYQSVVGDASARKDPQITSSFAPRYPPTELRSGIGGTVKLKVDLDASGYVSNATVVSSSRNRNLDRAAMDVVRRWKYSPAIEGGRTVPSSMMVPIDFTPPAAPPVGTQALLPQEPS